MKAFFLVRMAVAAILATLGIIGWAASVPGSNALLFIAGLLLVSYEELTRPVPRGERWWTLLLVGVLLAGLLLAPFLRWPSPPGKIVRIALAVLGWLFCMGAIYRRCLRKRGQINI